MKIPSKEPDTERTTLCERMAGGKSAKGTNKEIYL